MVAVTKVNLTGKRFTRWLVIEEAVLSPAGHGLWVAVCDCGVQREVKGISLKTGKSKSCGCLQSDTLRKLKTTHGKTGTPEYLAWEAMWNRCTNPNSAGYPEYKHRLPPPEWRNFEVFLADLGLKPSKFHTLERTNNALPYGPQNCEWATRSTQARNTSRTRMLTLGSETKCMLEWAEVLGIKASTIRSRLDYLKWPVEKALTKAVGKYEIL
jgi:hypothetical protein